MASNPFEQVTMIPKCVHNSTVPCIEALGTQTADERPDAVARCAGFGAEACKGQILFGDASNYGRNQ